MRVTGSLLFIVGIAVALISAAKLPVSGTLWSDMLPIYGVSVLFSVIGLVLLRWPLSPQNSLKKGSEQADPSVIDLLQQLLAEMQTVGSQFHVVDEVEIAKRVNRLLESYVLPLVAALKSGNQRVESIVAIAQGERLLNRTWSAASDGHKTEAIASYNQALAAFEQAYRLSSQLGMVNDL
jgi:hypothetical protein